MKGPKRQIQHAKTHVDRVVLYLEGTSMDDLARYEDLTSITPIKLSVEQVADMIAVAYFTHCRDFRPIVEDRKLLVTEITKRGFISGLILATIKSVAQGLDQLDHSSVPFLNQQRDIINYVNFDKTYLEPIHRTICDRLQHLAFA